jgi:serine/threonine protein kinase
LIGDLSDKIQKQHGQMLAKEQIIDWFIQLCLALKYIHGMNILHRGTFDEQSDLGSSVKVNCLQQAAKVLLTTLSVQTDAKFLAKTLHQELKCSSNHWEVRVHKSSFILFRCQVPKHFHLKRKCDKTW